MLKDLDARAFFTELFSVAVAAANPEATIRKYLPEPPKGRTVVIGAGKAAAQMAEIVEKAWDSPIEGVVVTRYGAADNVKCQHIDVLEASHPVPDNAGLAATKRLFQAVDGLTKDDLVIALISGGGSALLSSPPEGMTLEDEIAVNEALLASGMPISSMNVIRKHLSTVKGGRLALAAHPARVVSLVISDVPGDNPALVASGPTVPDTASRNEALSLVAGHRLKLPEAAVRHLNSETASAPLPDDPRFADSEVHIIASAAISLEAAAQFAHQKLGIETVVFSDSIEGEARSVGGVHAALAHDIDRQNQPYSKPVLLLSGGETTVTLQSKGGKGGRNSEFLLALALGIQGMENVYAFAADTDGIDGSENNAGAFADGSSIARMQSFGVDADEFLRRNDAYTAFSTTGDLFVTGPTGTNVNDLRALLIL